MSSVHSKEQGTYDDERMSNDRRINNVSPSITEFELIKLRADKAEMLAMLKLIKGDIAWNDNSPTLRMINKLITKIEDK